MSNCHLHGNFPHFSPRSCHLSIRCHHQDLYYGSFPTCHVLSQTSYNICIMRIPLNYAILLDFYTFHRVFRKIFEGGNIPKHLLPPRLIGVNGMDGGVRSGGDSKVYVHMFLVYWFFRMHRARVSSAHAHHAKFGNSFAKKTLHYLVADMSRI